METQLIHLTPPYNLICNKESKFGLHIATLMVINPFGESNRMFDAFCFPVVESFNEPGGELWDECELETCKVICRYQDRITLQQIKEVMDYHFGWSDTPAELFIWDLKKALLNNKSHVLLPKVSGKNGTFYNENKEDYEVELVFKDYKDTEICIINSSEDSHFYFAGSIDFNSGSRARPGDDEETAILKMARLRNAYLMAFAQEGVEKITFFTKNKEYQGYVDKLNSYPIDE